MNTKVKMENCTYVGFDFLLHFWLLLVFFTTLLSNDFYYDTSLLSCGWFVVSFKKFKKKLNKNSVNGYFSLIYCAVLVIVVNRIITLNHLSPDNAHWDQCPLF